MAKSDDVVIFEPVEAPDMFSMSGMVTPIFGTAGATEAQHDSLAITGSVSLSGSISALIEATDTTGIVGAVVILSTDATFSEDTVDTFSIAAGKVIVIGSAHATDVRDVASIPGQVVVPSTVVLTEHNDVLKFGNRGLTRRPAGGFRFGFGW